jgi:hypothetical protein
MQGFSVINRRTVASVSSALLLSTMSSSTRALARDFIWGIMLRIASSRRRARLKEGKIIVML